MSYKYPFECEICCTVTLFFNYAIAAGVEVNILEKGEVKVDSGSNKLFGFIENQVAHDLVLHLGVQQIAIETLICGDMIAAQGKGGN